MSRNPSARIAWGVAVFGCLLLASCTTSPTPAPKRTGEDRLPQVIFRVPPIYPSALSKEAISGKVVVEFVVAKTGEVHNPTVVEATDPRFGPPAVDAILRWKFRPGMKDGEPVNALLRQEMEFHVSTQDDPPAFDPTAGTPPQAIHRATVRYPAYLVQQGIQGAVLLEFTVNTSGDVVDAKVVASTNKEFEQPALECIRQWKYRPAQHDGRPVNARLRQEISFNLGN